MVNNIDVSIRHVQRERDNVIRIFFVLDHTVGGRLSEGYDLGTIPVS